MKDPFRRDSSQANCWLCYNGSVSLYSYSRISTYEACPLRYKYAYIDEVKTEAEETLPAYMDARVHEALERLYRNLQVQKKAIVEGNFGLLPSTMETDGQR